VLVCVVVAVLFVIQMGTLAPVGAGPLDLSEMPEQAEQLAVQDHDPNLLVLIVAYDPRQVTTGLLLAATIHYHGKPLGLDAREGTFRALSGGVHVWVYLMDGYDGTPIQLRVYFLTKPKAEVGCGLWQREGALMLDKRVATGRVSCSNPNNFRRLPMN